MATSNSSLNPFLLSSVRSIPPKTRGNRGYFPSSKVDRGIVNYESQIERDFFLILDHADDVIKFQHQPITIHYNTLEKEIRKYTPDVYVEFSNGIKLLVELKDEASFQNDYLKFKERWDACKIWSKKRGIDFIVLTDFDIRNARLSNIWFTLGSAKVVNNDKYMKTLYSFISKNIAYNDLCEGFAEDLGLSVNKSSQIICYAIYHGLIFIDTFSTDTLSRNTIIRRRNNKKKSPFKSLWIELDEMLEFRDENRIFKIKEKALKNIQSNIIFNYDEKLNTKEKIVREFLRIPSHKRNLEWRNLFEKKYNTKIRTVYRWVEQYNKQGIEGLVSKLSMRGNKSKYDNEALEYLENARRYWLNPNISFTKAYDDKSTSKKNNSLRKIWNHDSIKMPSLSTFKRYIRDNTSYTEEVQSKRGKKQARSLKPSLKSFQGAIMPMQVLQFDNTSFDVFITDSILQVSIGTPNLCAAIDCYTRMITGFELTLNSINRQSILETLVQSILNKEPFLEQIFSNDEVYSSWNIEGFPVLMLIDNGMDYRSNDVRDFCLEFDIIIEFAPIRTPRYKAYIENWFSILKYGLNEELANEGYRPSLKKRIINPYLDPEQGAIFNFQRMEKWLTSWILDEYHFVNPYNDGLPAPYLKFENFQKGIGNIILPLPREPPVIQSNRDKLVRYSLMSAFRKFKSEIEWENLKYSSEELREVWRLVGNKEKVELRYDYRDIRTLWLKSPLDGKSIKIELSTGWANAIGEFYQDHPISLSAWKKEIKELKKGNKNRITPFIYRKEMGRLYREKLKEIAMHGQKEGKKARRKKEVLKENIIKLNNKQIEPKSRKGKKQTIGSDEEKINDEKSNFATTSFKEAKEHMPAFWDYEEDVE